MGLKCLPILRVCRNHHNYYRFFSDFSCRSTIPTAACCATFWPTPTCPGRSWPRDVRLNLIARNMAHYQQIYRTRILTLPHIADIEALMHIATLKSSDGLPL